MTTAKTSFTPDYFECIYAKNVDPWKFATSRYELTKYATTMAVLGERNFQKAFEVGCSIGILTRMLADRCGGLLAVDVSEIALNQARRNCSGMTNVALERMQVPSEWPEYALDLIVLSEVLYFLSPHDIGLTAIKSIGSLNDDGLIALVNWTGGTDYPCGGDEAAEIFLARAAHALTPVLQLREQKYRLDVLAAS